jgi:hypothetical protein
MTSFLLEARAAKGRSPTKFLAHGTCGVSNLVHEPLQFFARDAEVFAPVFDLVVLVHVDATTIRLAALQNVI